MTAYRRGLAHEFCPAGLCAPRCGVMQTMARMAIVGGGLADRAVIVGLERRLHRHEFDRLAWFQERK
jgi:hypothetical protein